jgi:hypothetical protein
LKESAKRESLLKHVAKELDDYAQHKKDGTLEEYREESFEYVMELLAGMYKKFTFEEEKEHAA